MNWLKIVLLPLSVLITSLILFGIEHFFHDRRTKKYKSLRNILILTLFITAIINGYFIFYDQQHANDSYKGIVQRMQNDSIQYEKRHKESVNQRDSLKLEIIKLSQNLNPFIELSKKKYPSYSINSGLEKLIDEIKEVKERTYKIENKIKSRHVNSDVSTYITEKLKKNESHDILLQFDPTDIEARTFAYELKVSIQNGGWKVKDFQLQAIQPNPGISIYCRNNEKSQKIAQTLWTVLKNSGVYKKDDIYLSDSGGDWIVKLYVGPKHNN